ncbi:Senescence associated gene 20, putative [Theobroma cacao]|uniref:Senescence associated gene 20, putative n=1 Tax=Theobroma cacao TaxID=3641 RepID=A0A061GYQ0_THECC|nr:Senescence associated gene 20, putative [Theobroma cacao]
MRSREYVSQVHRKLHGCHLQISRIEKPRMTLNFSQEWRVSQLSNSRSIPYLPPQSILKIKHHPSFPFSGGLALLAEELANNQARLEGQEEEYSNERVVRALYDALNSRDVETVHRLLAADLEWWFHGPPSHQHLMRLLTGSTEPFIFVPLRVAAFGSLVIVEGYNKERDVSWVHAWTVTNGIITQVREYFNTSLTVARLSNSEGGPPSISSAPTVLANCQSIWQSKLCDDKAVPGLVLAL